MTRIGPSDRLSELLRIVGTQKTENKNQRKTVADAPASSTTEKSQESLRAELARELASVDISQEAGRDTARKILIHRVILSRFGKIQPSAAQLSFLTREVSEKAAGRSEILTLLDDVIRDVVGGERA